jgi:hypothetical protein
MQRDIIINLKTSSSKVRDTLVRNLQDKQQSANQHDVLTGQELACFPTECNYK